MATEQELDVMTDEELDAYMNEVAMTGDVQPEQVEVDNLEQPEDSGTEDSNIPADDEVDDVNEDEPSEAEVDVQDEAEEQVAETDTKEVEPEVQVRKYKIKADKQEFEFTEEELIKLAPKAVDYTKKMQEIAPYRKRISAMKDENITDEDFNLMMDVFKGNKEALASILKKTGIDAFDLDTEKTEPYVPNSYGKDDAALALEEIVTSIQKDPEYDYTRKVVDEQWDASSRQELLNSLSDPSLRLKDGRTYLEGIHDDIKTGVYVNVAPIAAKLKILDGATKSDLEYYKQAAIQHAQSIKPVVKDNSSQQLINNVKAMRAEQDKLASASNKRKAATLPKTGVTNSNVIDYLDADKMSDEEFEAMMDKQIKG